MPPRTKNRSFRSNPWSKKFRSVYKFRWTIIGTSILTFIYFYCTSKYSFESCDRNGYRMLPLFDTSIVSILFFRNTSLELLGRRDKSLPRKENQQSDFNPESDPESCEFVESWVLRRHFHYDPSSFKSQYERDFWTQPDGEGLHSCLEPSQGYKNKSKGIVKSEIYLVTVLTGGLNQMRLQTGNAVILARILNATLIVPIFSFNENWQDDSEFADVFDVPHLQKTLANDVRILTTLPNSHLRMSRAIERDPPLNATPAWYWKYFYPLIRKNHVMVLRGLDACLTTNLPSDLLKLRCKVEFEALRFAKPLMSIGNELVKRMAAKGPYLALHLRMEKDVWVHTGCLPGISRSLDKEIETERLYHPEKLKSRSNLTFQERLVSGLCPLSTSLTVKLLKYLGASNRTHILLVGGKPFGGKLALRELRTNFPNLHSKESLARKGELDPFLPHGNMLSAIDFLLSINSDVYLATHGGNMAHAVQGHRAYNGHRKHITPNKRKLVTFFSQQQVDSNLTEREIRMEVWKMHKDSIGRPKSRLDTKKGDTIATPYPDCMCVKR